jgi:chemotaxis methyl-accepting protein methylase
MKPAAPDLVYTVSIAGSEYGIEAAQVEGTFAIERMARVRGASPDVLGLHSWQGTPLAVLDPCPHLGVLRAEGTNQGTAIVVRLGGAHVAFAVDNVSGPLPDSRADRQMLDPGSLLGGRAPAPDPWAGLRAALQTHASYTVSDVNIDWVMRRYRSRKWGRVLPSTEKRAAEFLAGFGSPCVDTLWNESLRAGLRALLPGSSTRHFAIWNHGCGRGNDALSLACIFAMDRPRLKVKIWAVDELAAIVEAQSSSWSAADVPEYLGKSGHLDQEGGRFSGGGAVRAKIILVCAEAFEPVPEAFDMIVCRDRLSYLDAGSQAVLLRTFRGALRPGGIVITGLHEKLPSDEWSEQPDTHLRSWAVRRHPS